MFDTARTSPPGGVKLDRVNLDSLLQHRYPSHAASGKLFHPMSVARPRRRSSHALERPNWALLSGWTLVVAVGAAFWFTVFRLLL
jgi:hypothetical protein